MKIDEVIVVEGRDDTAALKRSVDCETIETHGFGMSDNMWARLDLAYKKKGLIIFTDPDHAGGQIRHKLKTRYPDAGEAWLPRAEAEKKGNIGVENASPEAIREALTKSLRNFQKRERNAGKGTANEGVEMPCFTMEDLKVSGLIGAPRSREKREKAADILGIGYCNGKTFLSRLNHLGITREEFYGALRSTDHKVYSK